MKFKQNKKLKIFFSLLTTGAILASSFSGISAINVEQKNISDSSNKSIEEKFLEQIKNANSIQEVIKGSFLNYRSYKELNSNSISDREEIIRNGANRIEIVFKSGVDKTIINKYVKGLINLVKDNRQYFYGKHTLTFTTTFNDLDDFKNLFLILGKFKMDLNNILQINVHDTNFNYN
ncbi:hypothetical protein CJJ23_04300 [Mycoplasmopsis agassizii]|uniref:Uncharacterized protein n=1 Tax=Mycoplasmopsis agassizii TaxID=33922 RepID=A0A269TIJ2_9BACT|nr:hypothetical protein [Mycoplasmopsis agassizii]PAK21000.1 hypothetical protein CJJ23_04300 [Mycoplasmopsis agassizii]